MKAIFGVPDKLIPRMKLGEPLSLHMEAFGDRILRGRLTRISAAADPKSRVFEVEVSVPNTKDDLKIGMIATLVVHPNVLAESQSSPPLRRTVPPSRSWSIWSWGTP